MAYLKTTLLAALIAIGAPAALFAQSPAPATAAAPAQAQPQASSAGEDERGYILGPGDTIEVSVLGQPEFTTRARVRADGSIALPFLGDVNVGGKSVLALSDDVAARLRSGGYYAKPIVNVEVVSYASRYVTVLGDVAQPGLQPVDRDYRVSEIIARAGGIRDTGADYVIVRRESGEELRLPFETLAIGGAAEDPFVRPGDKVFVPQAELFYIYGQVNAPGAYPIRDEMTLRKAIARGGGLTPAGSAKRVKVYHDGVEQRAELERKVEPGDVIVIGERLF